MTRLQILVKYLGWQGGTIHQVNEEFRRVLSPLNSLPDRIKNIDMLSCDEGDYHLAIDLYARNLQ